MVQLYNQTPIAIFLTNNDNLIRVNFCNVKMKMKPCQFRFFNNYLSQLSKQINEHTDSVELLLVKDNLKITISLNHFLQLCNGVQIVMKKK